MITSWGSSPENFNKCAGLKPRPTRLRFRRRFSRFGDPNFIVIACRDDPIAKLEIFFNTRDTDHDRVSADKIIWIGASFFFRYNLKNCIRSPSLKTVSCGIFLVKIQCVGPKGNISDSAWRRLCKSHVDRYAVSGRQKVAVACYEIGLRHADRRAQANRQEK